MNMLLFDHINRIDTNVLIIFYSNMFLSFLNLNELLLRAGIKSENAKNNFSLQQRQLLVVHYSILVLKTF